MRISIDSAFTSVDPAAAVPIRDLLILNLTLQVFDGLFSYQAFSLGAAEANPFVSAAIASWGVIYGLLYKKILACALLLLVFAFRHRLPNHSPTPCGLS